MAHNPLFGAQPFEELANEPEPTSPTSLEEFYKEQEKKDLERRLSKTRSLRRRRGRSKSFASTSDPPYSPEQEQPRSPLKSPEGYFDRQLVPVQEQPGSSTPPQQQELAWHRERAQTGSWFMPEQVFKTHYEIHNPIPPAIPWTNHHLRPPGAPWPPTSQPRKISITSRPDAHIQFIAGPSPILTRDPQGINPMNSAASSNPLPKNVSLTALSPPAIYGPDHIDMLDPSDPWGMRWHHDGRYDVGDFTKPTRGNPTATWAGTASPAVDVPTRQRPNAPNFRGNPKSPSPLSQSTSAVQSKNGSSISLDTPKQLQRRLSKRNSAQPSPPSLPSPNNNTNFETKRSSGFRGFFSGSRESSTSAPNYLYAPQMQLDRRRSKTLGTNDPSTPSENVQPTPSAPADYSISRPPSKTLTAPPSSYRSSLTPSPPKEKEKRSSYLGRLVKKFSIIRNGSESESRHSNPHGTLLKRSVSTANGIYAPKETEAGHPKFASAPDKVESPIGSVPELRLVHASMDGHDGQQSHPQEEEGIDNPPTPKGSPRTPRSPAPSRGSPEPQIARVGGLVITNPDTNASEVESMHVDSPRGSRPTLPNPSAPKLLDLDDLPQPSFLRGVGSNQSSPGSGPTPLRVVNGRDPETETETGTINGMLIASPVSITSTIPPTIPSPSDKRRSLHSNMNARSAVDLALLSAIPSIPDLPATPDISVRSIGSPKSEDMETALETMSPPTSALSLSVKSLVSSSAPPSRESPRPRESPIRNTESPRPRESPVSNKESPRPGELPVPNKESPRPRSSPLSNQESPPPNETPEPPRPRTPEVPRSRRVSTRSSSTIMSVSSATTAAIPSPVPTPGPPSPAIPVTFSISMSDVPRPRPSALSTSSSEVYARPSPRGTSLANTARYGAYYSPSLYPAAALSVPTPQTELNPLPTPPARLPLPLHLENSSRERLTSTSKERLDDRASEKRKSRDVEKEKEVASPSSISVASPTSLSSHNLASPPPHALGSPTRDKPKSNEPVKEKRNQSTFKIFGQSSEERPSSKDSEGRPRPKELLNGNTIVSRSRELLNDDPRRSGLRDSPKRTGSNDTINANSGRAPIESNSNYNVFASRPSAIHANSYHSSISREREGDSPVESDSMRRKRALSAAASSDTASISLREDARRRANSIKGGDPSWSSSTNGTNGSSKASSRKPSITTDRRDPRRERDQEPPVRKEDRQDPSKQVISGFGQSWEVIEAVMFQPEQPEQSGANRQGSHHREMSGGGSRDGTGSTRQGSGGGTSFPPRISSRSGYTASGEPISLSSPNSNSSFAPSIPPKRAPSKDQPPVISPSSSKDKERYKSQYERERDRETARKAGEERAREREREWSQTPAPAPVRVRSKSRPREAPLPPGVNLNKPQPPRPPPTPATSQQALPTLQTIANGVPTPFQLAASASTSRSLPPSAVNEAGRSNSKLDNVPSRRESLQRARPTSEVVNIPELGAQEAWEHDRMTARGQSVLLPDGFVIGPSNSQRASAGSSLSQPQSQYAGQQYAGQPYGGQQYGGPQYGGQPYGGQSYGSSAGSAHTRIVVQPPFQMQARPPPNPGYYYSQQAPIPNPLPAPPATIMPPKTRRNRI